jgi:hypothetical protein
MQNITKPAIAVGLLAALGIGCYTWGQHADKQPQTPMPTASAVAPASLATPAAPPPLTPARASVNPPQGAQIGANPVTNQNVTTEKAAVLSQPGAFTPQQWTQTRAVTTQTATGDAQIPSQPGTISTYTEKKTTTVHQAYVHRTYKHHRTDKVHMARATKHGVMFALKLPGRMAL